MTRDQDRDRVPAGQSGMAIVLVLFFLVAAGLFGFASYQRTRQDMGETVQDARMAKSKFAAEAAAYMGLGLVDREGASAPACVTHDSTGKAPATGPEACGAVDLSGYDRVYPHSALKVDPKDGWLSIAPKDTAESLTGTLREKLEVKIWRPTAASVRVVGRGTVNGIATDMQLFGEWTP